MEMALVDSARLLNVASVVLAVAFLWVLSSVRREHIRVEYSVSWLMAAGSLFVLSRWSAANLWLAQQLGVGSSALALLLVAGAAFVTVLYRTSLRVSGLRETNIKLAQRIAILEYRLESVHEEAGQAGKTL